MKDFKLWTVLSHVNLVLSIMFMTFFFIDRVNPAMNFIDSEISKFLLLAFAILALTQAIVAIVFTRRIRNHRYEKEVSEERKRKRAEIIETMNETGCVPDALLSKQPAHTAAKRTAPRKYGIASIDKFLPIDTDDATTGNISDIIASVPSGEAADDKHDKAVTPAEAPSIGDKQ